MAKMWENIDQIIVTEKEIKEKVDQLGQAITHDYAGKEPILVCILKGAALFMADLLRAITVPIYLDFMAISSYGAGQESSGMVKLVKDLDQPITGKDVIIIEDVINTGLTISYILDQLRARRPKSLEVCALLDKPSRHRVAVPLKYVGFEIPGKYVVGYGLDYNQRYRNLPFVCTLKPQVYQDRSL